MTLRLYSGAFCLEPQIQAGTLPRVSPDVSSAWPGGLPSPHLPSLLPSHRAGHTSSLACWLAQDGAWSPGTLEALLWSLAARACCSAVSARRDSSAPGLSSTSQHPGDRLACSTHFVVR